jgi:hypothetical protein
MAWDKNLPSGSADIGLGDNVIRANNAAIETALGAEHEFSTGGTNAGRHKFVSGNDAARDAITTWDEIDVFQATIPRVDEQSEYTVTQWGEWASVSPVAGSPDTVAIDLSLSPYKYATIVGDTLIQNPTNNVASHGTTVILQLTMSGAGHVITFGNNYRSANGLDPVIADGNGEITLVYIQSIQAGAAYLVTTVPNMAAF